MARRLILAILAVLLAAATARADATVTLRATASAPAGGDILLHHIAELVGEEARSLGETTILTAEQARAAATGGQLRIELSTVRAALDKAGVNWGRTVLSGGTTVVRIEEAGTVATPAVRRQPAPRSAEAPTHRVVDLSGEPTVRTHIAARLAHLFGVAPEDLRLKFRVEDEPLLETRTRGRRVDVQPAASAASGRIPLRIYIYAGDRIALSGGVTVEAQVRREVLTATAPIERGEAITPDRIATSARWMSPNDKPPATLDHVAGAEARTRIDAGEIITAEAIQPPLAARRGDIVTVHCLSGGITVRLRARAQSDVRDGEIGTFRAEGAKKTFAARMDGPGRAVMIAGGPNEDASR